MHRPWHGASSYERQRPALDKPHDDDDDVGHIARNKLLIDFFSCLVGFVID